ncbi:LOW QUALITY PROTEIN: reverse transcriptase [Phytophthora megakarya]|uniref:Reverse transcriptase n=1 Tax=Phytophthora megakarya TaxID=4795 RepID=A0A225VRV0_9STRA|nr:LOW QUALITY PROTEIN: reverse transcriptase [Phytophthora megakarya]
MDRGSQEVQVVDHRKTLDLEAPDPTEVDPRWIHAHRSFDALKAKITTTPILRPRDWAISGSLMQEYDQIYYLVMFASRTLKSNELNYGIAEKEVLALLRILDLNYNTLVGRPIHVLTRHSTLAWLFRSTALHRRIGQWAALLSPWTLEITKCVKGEDEILGALAASITPRSEVDKALTSIAPKKEPRRKIQAPIPTIGRDEDLYVFRWIFPCQERGGGAYSAILWKLPEWRVLKTRFGYAEGLTVNEAEYHGLLLCLDLLEYLDPRRLVICGDSNLVIRQRDWNGSTDSLANAALQRQCGIEVETEDGIQDLVTLNRLDEILVVKIEDEIAQISAVTIQSKARSGVRIGSDPDSLREEVVRELRIERIRQAQDEESWILDLKKYLVGEIRDLTQDDAKMFRSIAMNYEVDQSDLLFYCPTTKEEAADRDKLMRLVIPETLQQDILHHYHTSLQGGHQGIGRTYDRIRDHFHWRGLYKTIQRYVGECVDYETGKGRPRIQGESPGNLQATYPFQIIAMDYIPSLPRSFNGNTELLIFVDLFSGYVIAKASASRSAQSIAETYEECVFRRFGPSEGIRHDREPGFMSDFLSPSTRSWDNVNVLLWLIDPKLMDPQSVWSGQLPGLLRCMCRIWINEIGTNTLNGSPSRSTLQEIYFGSGDPSGEHSQARSKSKKMAISDRPNMHNDLVRPHPVESGSRVWLYLDRVREGYAKKLAHLWHGIHSATQNRSCHKFVAGSLYSIFPLVHVSKIKLVKIFPDRPIARLNEADGDPVDFDEAPPT